MVRRSFLQELRRRGAAIGAVLSYALLLSVLLGVVLDVRAVAAALDPLSGAATCNPSGSGPADEPAGPGREHQADCTLCGPACPMGGAAQGLGGAVAPIAAPSVVFDLPSGGRRAASVNPPSLYRSDADAQAPPAIG